MVHTNAPARTGLIALEALTGAGVDPKRIVIAHAGDSNDLDYLRAIADTGASLGCDRFKVDHFNPDARRIETLAALAAEGYTGSVHLGHDAACFYDFMFQNPFFADEKPDYLHISHKIVPALLAAGVTQAQVERDVPRQPAPLLHALGLTGLRGERRRDGGRHIRDLLEDTQRAGAFELGCGKAACQDSDERNSRAVRRLPVPDRVADQHRVPGRRPIERREHHVGLRFGRRDVLLRHGHRAQALEAEDAEKGIGMACDRRRGQHHGEPLAFEAVRHFTRTIEAADLGEDRVEALLPRCAHRIAEVALDPGAGDGGDELVASHADVAVKAPHGNVEVVIAKAARPCDRVVVRRVDERSVDVEEDRSPAVCRRHRSRLTMPAPRALPGDFARGG